MIPIFMSGLAVLGALNPTQMKPIPTHAPLKIVTFNLYNERPERQERLQSAIVALRALNPDVLLLQEVAGGILKPGNPVSSFGNALGLPYREEWTLQNALVYRNGLAILSRYALKNMKGLKFSQNLFFEVKGAMMAEVMTPEGSLPMVNVHLTPKSEGSIKASQFEELKIWIQENLGKRSSVIAGDFNESFSRPLLSTFAENLKLENLYSHLPKPKAFNTFTPDYRRGCHDPQEGEQIDFVFLTHGGKKWSFKGGEIVEPQISPPPSDHCPVVAEIQFH